MPRYDGTGPRGQGPMTGGGRGFCAVPYGRPASVPYGRPMSVPYMPQIYPLPIPGRGFRGGHHGRRGRW